MGMKYVTYGDYKVIWDQDTNSLQIRYGKQELVKELCFEKDGRVLSGMQTEYSLNVETHDLLLVYGEEDAKKEIRLAADEKGVTVTVPEPLGLTGIAGTSPDSVAMSCEKHDFFRSAWGKAVTSLDNMLFDRQTDTGLVMDGDLGRRFWFDYEKNVYLIRAQVRDTARFTLKEQIYEKEYGIDYGPINKNITFSKPPVGWMTWYAVKFNASEDTVLENTRWMAENLKKYGAEAVWVDWEWYHKDLSGVRDDGTDTFHPDPEKYPNGMKYLSDEIRKLGFVPNLWVGFSTDPGENDFIKEHPEIVLLHKSEWCGQYFMDMSHPVFLNEFLPKALKQVDDWGYEAVKFDALPMTISKHEEFHERMYDPDMTTKEAFRGMIKKTRELIGYDRYLLSCCGYLDSDVLWACDLFDAARVGGDIFNWSEFITEGIGQTARYYPLHNVVIYNDPDNVVIREEFNNMEQAKTRVAFVSLLGLPFTFGDNLPELPQERVEILKRGIPVLDIRPMDVARMKPQEIVIIHTAMESAFDAYSLVSVMNTSGEEKEEKICLKELGIDGDVCAFEYYSSSLVSLEEGVLRSVLKPYETKVYAVREKKAHPQLLSTSRHLYQGALEVKAMQWMEADCELAMSAELVEGDLYTVTVAVPDGYGFAGQQGFDEVQKEEGLIRLSVTSDQNRTGDFKISFRKQ